MTEADASGALAWADAALAAALFAVDPAGLGGVRLQARPGPVRERWLELLQTLSAGRALVRVPPQVGEDRLFGGLDLTATLQAGRPLTQRGLLAEADGGAVVLAMAERVDPGIAAGLATTQDREEVYACGAGQADAALPARFGVVAIDESTTNDDPPANCLLERLGLRLALDPIPPHCVHETEWDREDIESARARVPDVEADASAIEALCAAAMQLGIASLRVPVLALRAARAHAALAARDSVGEDDVAAAARLVLGPRATTVPASAEESEAEPEQCESQPEQGDEGDDPESPGEQPEAPREPESQPSSSSEPEQTSDEGAQEPEPASAEGDEQEEAAANEADLSEVVLEAARARIPEGLLDPSLAARAARGPAAGGGKAGAMQASGRRGRPAGVRRGTPGPMARLNVVETLRAAAPWQPLRRRETGAGRDVRVDVRREDLRVSRYRERRETATIFVVDASGSAALNRLAEAKGAVELLLADCYVRRDQVALISFRGHEAELLLPPTRSLVRAKRCLAELPGGGGTPLAAGIDAALHLADRVARSGMTPMVVLLTDGRANVAADGSRDRDRAEHDAHTAARGLRAAGVPALLVDTAPRSRPAARELAAAMGARHLPLPYGDAARLSAVVREAAA